jgi:hypothetical protein
MTRHTITNELHEVSFGWDGPMLTYFLQIFTKTEDSDEYDELLEWFGKNIGEFSNPDKIIIEAKKYSFDLDRNVLLAEKLKESNICCLCTKPYNGYGNNARPLNNGNCCNQCNLERVIPARLIFEKF